MRPPLLVCALMSVAVAVTATVAPAWPRLNGGSAPDPVGDAAAVAAGLAAAADVAVPEPGAKLRQVQVFFRHGARAPYYEPGTYYPSSSLAPYWTQPYYNDYAPNAYNDCQLAYPGADTTPANFETGAPSSVADFASRDRPSTNSPSGACLTSWLTPQGYDAALDLGAVLRKRYLEAPPYAAAAPKTWAAASASVFAMSTTTQRTFNTLRGVLTGMWPDAAGTPVTTWFTPYASNPPNWDQALDGGYVIACPSVAPDALAQQRAFADAKYPSLWQAAAADAVTKATGVNMTACVGPAAPDFNVAASRCWQMLYEALAVMNSNGVPWPAGVTKELFNLISTMDIAYVQGEEAPTAKSCLLDPPSRCDRVLQAMMGWAPWLATCNARRAVAGACGVCHGGDPAAVWAGEGCPSAAPSVLLYASHDSNMKVWASILGFNYKYWPWITTNMAIETWVGPTGTAWVRVRHNGVPVAVPLPAGAEGAAVKKVWMTLDEFEVALAPVTLAPSARAAFCAV